MSMQISKEDILSAKKELSQYLPPSPLLFNPWLSEIYDCELYLKLENMQPVGSFKIRGATYRISQLTEEERKRGVIAASLGNHAQGVAWGSRRLGVNAVIVMPKGASITKIEATERLGAKVRLEGENVAEAIQIAHQISKEKGRVYIHPYQDPQVIAGQGTLGLEILDQLPDVEAVIGSIGGGGLMAGVALAIKSHKPEVKIYGGQAKAAAAMAASFEAGRIVPFEAKATFADGIAVPVASEEMLALLKPNLEKIYQEDDENIAAAILTLMEKAKVVAEGAGALPLSVLRKIKKEINGKKVVLVICGGNIDVNVLSRIVDSGLVRSGRRLRLQAYISDRPGSLSKLTQVIAGEGANVLQVIHDRNEPGTRLDETSVALTLETRGLDHSQAVIQAIRDEVERVNVLS